MQQQQQERLQGWILRFRQHRNSPSGRLRQAPGIITEISPLW
jgi:hypothetical protein